MEKNKEQCYYISPPRTYLRMFASQVSVHGSTGGHLGPTEVTGLSLHLLVRQVDVLLQHILGQVFLVTGGTRPRLAHCNDSKRNLVQQRV